MLEDPKSRRSTPSPYSDGLLLGWKTDFTPSIGFQSSPDNVTSSVKSPLVYSGPGHHLCVASTGTGKGTGVAVPTLLTNEASAIVLDVKGELAQICARRRRDMGHEVRIIDPFHLLGSASSDSFNIFDVARLGTDPEDYARIIVNNLTGDRQSARDPFWDISAAGILSGMVCHAMTTPNLADRSLGYVRDLFSCGDLAYRIATLLDSNTMISTDAQQEFKTFLDMPEPNTRGGVQATAAQHLTLFGSAAVRRATTKSTFSVESLHEGQPITIFLVIPCQYLRSHAALIRCWLAALLTVIFSRTVMPQLPTLLLLDEIGHIARLPLLEDAVTLGRGMGLQVMMIFQDVQQMEKVYPDAYRSMVNNCGVIQTFGMRNYAMATSFANLIGGISAEALMNMSPDQQVVLIEGGKPEICRRLNYLSDPLFQKPGFYDPNPRYGKRKKVGTRRR